MTFGNDNFPQGWELVALSKQGQRRIWRLARIFIGAFAMDCAALADRPHTLFYAIQSYWATAGYGVEFGLSNMSDAMRTMKGCALSAANDHPKCASCRRASQRTSWDIRYTVGGEVVCPQARTTDPKAGLPSLRKLKNKPGGGAHHGSGL